MTSVYDSTEVTLQGGGGRPLLEASLDFESLLNFPTSPVGSEGYTSETSSTTNCNRVDSPVASLVGAGGSGSTSEHHLVESPSPLIAAGFSDPSQWSPMSSGYDTAKRNSGSDFSSSGWSGSPGNQLDTPSTTVSSDIRIDVGKLSRMEL